MAMETVEVKKLTEEAGVDTKRYLQISSNITVMYLERNLPLSQEDNIF